MSRSRFYLDLLERTVWTALQAAGAYMIENGLDFSEGGWPLIRNAAILAVIKSLVVNKLPWTSDDSASTLPENVDPPQDDNDQPRDNRGRFARKDK